MSTRPDQEVKNFLLKHYFPGKPLLLGFSGGPDSLALLHLLLESSQYIHFDLHVAHVDHAWREESASEAVQLKKYIESLGLPFHLLRLDQKPKQNLEESGRQARLSFFKNLYEEGNFQAVLLAHHRDDQAETVLKRVCEGAFIANLKGLEPISFFEGMPLWRPLLKFSKHELILSLGEKKHNALYDSTNEDQTFLRSRLRFHLLPFIEKNFGKNIKESLASIGSQASELRRYLDKRIAPYFNALKEGVFGFYIDFTTIPEIEKIEFVHFLKIVTEKEKISLSRNVLEALWETVIARTANYKVMINSSSLIIDRGIVFWLKQPLPQFSHTLSLKPAVIQDKEWQWEISCEPAKNSERCSNWKDLWRGEAWTVVPTQLLALAPYRSKSRLQKKGDIRKWWNEKKVPAFLRQVFPLIWEVEEVKHEFLSGENHFQLSFPSCQKIKITIKKNCP